VINTSVGFATGIKQALTKAEAELALITGQQPAERDQEEHRHFKLRKNQIMARKFTPAW